MKPVTVTVGPLTAGSNTAICAFQAPTAAAGFTINGSLAVNGVATMNTARRVIVWITGGSENGKIVTLNGTGYNGQVQSENITLTSVISVFQSVLDYKTITSVSISANAFSVMSVGTNDVASSPWVRFDDYAAGQVAIQCSASGSVTYSVQQTLQDPNSPDAPVNPTSLVWLNTSDPAAVNATSSVQTSYQYAPSFARITTSAGAGSTGTVSAIFTQHGVTPL